MYICCKIRNDVISDLKKFEVMNNAVLDFMIGTGFDKSLGEWVEEAGHYCCNDGSYGDSDFGEVIKLVIDMNYKIGDNKYALVEYDQQQYDKYYQQRGMGGAWGEKKSL